MLPICYSSSRWKRSEKHRYHKQGLHQGLDPQGQGQDQGLDFQSQGQNQGLQFKGQGWGQGLQFCP